MPTLLSSGIRLTAPNNTDIVGQRASGDTADRLLVGLSAVGHPRLQFGPGTGAADIIIRRDLNITQSLIIEGLSSGPKVQVNVSATSSGQHLGISSATEPTQYRIAFGLDGSDNPQMYLRRSSTGVIRMVSDQDDRWVVKADTGNARLGVAASSAAASNSFFVLVSGTDTQPRAVLGLDASGRGMVSLGGGATTAPDVTLYRSAAGVLNMTDAFMRIDRAAAGGAYVARLTADTQDRIQLRADGFLYIGPGGSTAPLQVVGTRRTGWTVATGTPSRATYATASVTLPVLAGVVMALEQDLIAHGLIGT